MGKDVTLRETYVQRAALAEIKEFSSPDVLVSSYYLDLDAELSGTTEGMRIEAKKVLARQRKVISDLDVDGDTRHALIRDWESIFEPALLAPGERHTRSLACFAASSAGIARVLRLPWPVRHRAFYEHQFVLWPLDEVLDQADHYVVCLADKDDARWYYFHLEQFELAGQISDEVPGKVRIPQPYDEPSYVGKHHRHVHYHFVKVADELLKLFRRRPFEHLIIGGLWEVLPEFEQHLHRYLSDRIIARWDLDVFTPPHEVERRAINEESQFLEHQKEETWRAINEQPPNLRAIGLDETLAALWLKQVDTMLVEPNARAAGFRCTLCRRMQREAAKCLECGSETAPVSNLFDEAEHAAVEQSAHVRFWKNPVLRNAGSIAASKRF
jgi:peptide chain release factor subunit 1